MLSIIPLLDCTLLHLIHSFALSSIVSIITRTSPCGHPSCSPTGGLSLLPFTVTCILPSFDPSIVPRLSHRLTPDSIISNIKVLLHFMVCHMYLPEDCLSYHLLCLVLYHQFQVKFIIPHLSPTGITSSITCASITNTYHMHHLEDLISQHMLYLEANHHQINLLPFPISSAL